MQPQMRIEDRYFYHPVAQKYAVDRHLDDLEKRGGILRGGSYYHPQSSIQYFLKRTGMTSTETLAQGAEQRSRWNIRVSLRVGRRMTA